MGGTEYLHQEAIHMIQRFGVRGRLDAFGPHQAQDARRQQHAMATRVADLPVQVFEALLLLLPIQTLFQARAVCKAWKTIISSTSFLPLWLEGSPNRYFLMGYPDGRQVMALSDMELARRWQYYTPSPPPFLSFSKHVNAIHPVASDGGLVVYLCLNSHNHTTTLCVFNPFTGADRMLPPLDHGALGMGQTEVLISTDDTGSGYVVFVVGLLSRPGDKNKASIALSIYSSKSRSWVKRGICPEDDSIAPGNWSAVQGNGVLYILSHVDGVISYDHTRDVWGRVGTPFGEIYVNGWLVHEKLMMHEGRLVLVGTTLERDEYTDELVHRLYIHELRTQPGYGDSPYVYWELFDRMPDAIMEDACPHSAESILPNELLEDVDPQSFAERNVLPVTCYQCDDVLLMFFHGMGRGDHQRDPALVACRLSTKAWTRIVRWNDFAMGLEKNRRVPFPPVEDGWPVLTFNVMGFQPSLSTV